MNLKRLLYLTVVTSLSVSAVFGILVFLIGDFGELEWRIIGTTFFVGVYSLSGLASFSLFEKKKYQLLGTANVTFSIASFFMTELAVWDLLNFDDIYKPVVAAGVIAYALAHISLLMLLNPKNSTVRLIRSVTIGAIIMVSTIITLLIFESISSFSDSGILRILGISAILSATGTILAPILNKGAQTPQVNFPYGSTPRTPGLKDNSLTESDLEIKVVKHAITGEKYHLFKETDPKTNKTELFIEPLNQ